MNVGKLRKCGSHRVRLEWVHSAKIERRLTRKTEKIADCFFRLAAKAHFGKN